MTEPEIDVNLIPAFCSSNPGVTAQVNLLKSKIVGDVLEADLIGLFGLPDKWSSKVPSWPFTAGFQVQGQWMPFGNLNNALRFIKVIIAGSLSYSQGVENQPPGWQVQGFIGLGHEFQFGPIKKEIVKERDMPSDFSRSPKLLKGALAVPQKPGPPPMVIVFQYNPEQLTRSLAHRAAPPNPSNVGGAREDSFRVPGPPTMC